MQELETRKSRGVSSAPQCLGSKLKTHRCDWHWGFALKVAGSHGRQVGPSHCGPLHGAARGPADVALASLPIEVTHCHFHGMLLVTQAALNLGGREPPKGVNARRCG